MPRFGAHMTIAGGLTTAIEQALRFRCRTLQVFVKNQQQWSAPPLTDEQVQAWRSALAATDLHPVVAHDSYLINLASADEALWRRSCNALAEEFDRCQRLGIDYLVTHPGAHKGAGERFGIERIVAALDRLGGEQPAGPTRLLLETTAGQGTSLGHRFEQIAEMIGRAPRPERLGVCLDTCHVFAAGYDLRSAAQVAATLDEFNRVVGLGRLCAIHLNDSKRELGSRVDRHEHVGLGRIGSRGLAAVVRQRRLAHLPMILETPKGVQEQTGREWDAVNLAKLRGFLRRGG